MSATSAPHFALPDVASEYRAPRVVKKLIRTSLRIQTKIVNQILASVPAKWFDADPKDARNRLHGHALFRSNTTLEAEKLEGMIDDSSWYEYDNSQNLLKFWMVRDGVEVSSTLAFVFAEGKGGAPWLKEVSHRFL
jgi:hypothetical protein